MKLIYRADDDVVYEYRGKKRLWLCTAHSSAAAQKIAMSMNAYAGSAAKALHELNERSIRKGVKRLKAEQKRMYKLGIIDKKGKRISKALPKVMLNECAYCPRKVYLKAICRFHYKQEKDNAAYLKSVCKR